MDIDKNTEFNLLRKKVVELGQQSKILESENRALKQFVEIFKDPVITIFQDRKYTNDAREYVYHH